MLGVVRHVTLATPGVVSFDTVPMAHFVEAYRSGVAAQVLDVRSPGEWADGHLERSQHCYLPDLAQAVPANLRKDQPVWIICGSGYRASAAASLLQRAGYQPLPVERGGVPDALRLLSLASVAA